jgi:hypothetical protein
MEKEAPPLVQEHLTPPSENDDGIFYTYKDMEPQHGKTWGWWIWIRENLNFFRIFLLVFMFLPLITSVIFWAVSTEYQVAYVDALYLCYSAFTDTGMIPFSSSSPICFSVLKD